MEELRYSQIRVSCSTYLVKKWSLSVIIRFENYKLDKVLLGDVASAEVSDPVDGHNPNVLDCAQQILKEGHFFMERNVGVTLKEMRYLHTPDLSVDLISSSRWSKITSLMNSYLLEYVSAEKIKKKLSSKGSLWERKGKIDHLTMQGSLLSLQFCPL